MKKLIFLTLMAFSISALAVQPGPQGRKSNYYYFELVPKEKLVLTLQADKICANDADRISVDEFESTASYPSTEKKGKVPVRVKSIFAESFSPCSSQPVGKLEKKIVVGPFDNHMTHIRLTISDGIQVSQANDCGMIPPGTTFDKNCKVVPVAPPKPLNQ
jgi:hypothetical protein